MLAKLKHGKKRKREINAQDDNRAAFICDGRNSVQKKRRLRCGQGNLTKKQKSE